jgi:FtsZ-binding cell division protein ZapB
MAVPATNVTMLFFNEIEELKKIIDSLTVKNREVQGENDILKKRN